MPESDTLSPQAVAILTLIAEGHSYSQILAHYPALTYVDIFSAAREALDVAGAHTSDYRRRIDGIRQTYPRAYQAWSDDEDKQLAALVGEGKAQKDIAHLLERQSSAISRRIEKLRLDMPAEG